MCFPLLLLLVADLDRKSILLANDYILLAEAISDRVGSQQTCYTNTKFSARLVTSLFYTSISPSLRMIHFLLV